MEMRTCVTPNLWDKINFERREVLRLKRQIEEANGYVDTPYITRFNREYDTYARVADWDVLYRAAEESRIIYLGDYHALPACQAFHATFLDRLAQHKPNLVLAMEMFYGRNQPALDAWMGGRIADATFLRRVEYDLEWGYNWEAYRAILQTARRHGVPAFGIDCENRNALQNLRLRDEQAARRILALLRRYPGHTLVVIFGESHLAGRHLPARVRHHLRRAGLRDQHTIILQNLEELYWNVCCKGHEGRQVVHVKPGVWCVFTATPFVKYEAYRQASESWRAGRDDDDELDLTASLHSLIDTILNFIQVDKYAYLLSRPVVYADRLIDVYPEIYGPEDRPLFKALLNASSLSQPEKSCILHHIERNGSCYVAGINAIYLGRLNVVHAAEEATHFAHFACRRQVGAQAPSGYRYRVDVFYTRVWEEALGYFGSKLIDPTRNHVRDSLFCGDKVLENKNLRPLGLTPRAAAAIVQYLRDHKRFEHDYRRHRRVPSTLQKGVRIRGRKLAIVTHELGYLLGEQLYRGYISGHVSRGEIRRLFCRRFDQPMAPLRAYLKYATKLARLGLKLYP